MAYLKPDRTSRIELFYEYSYRLLALNYIRKEALSQMFDRVLNTAPNLCMIKISISISPANLADV